MPTKRPRLKDGFDSRNYGSGYVKPVLASSPKELPTHSYVPNLNLYQGMDMIHVLLKDFQSRFVQPEREDLLWFPNAWIPLEKGDKIKNLDSGEIYYVDEVITTNKEYLKNYVRIKAKNNPKPMDMLRLDDKSNKTVELIPARPDVPMMPYAQGSEGFEQYDDNQDLDPWVDTITYTTYEEPGSNSGKPFGGGVQPQRPRLVEEHSEGAFYSMPIDGNVRLDFWTLSNENSQRMRIWFREFYMTYFWLMERNGLERAIWQKDYTETRANKWRPDITHRSSDIYIRTAYSFSKKLATISSTNVTFNVIVPRSNDDTDEIGESFTYSIN